MRVVITSGVKNSCLEERLWEIAVHSKTVDPEIKLSGLHVRVLPARSIGIWSGWALPREESSWYNGKLIHPAGRINLYLSEGMGEGSLVRLFSHELRHIGNFHRGRQQYGYLTDKHMKPDLVEPDCHEFEEIILREVGCKCQYQASCNSPHT